MHIDGSTFTEELVYCDASEELIVLQRYCLIPHSVLTAAPFSLTFDTLIQAKVRAINRNGASEQSLANEENPSLEDKIQQEIESLKENLDKNVDPDDVAAKLRKKYRGAEDIELIQERAIEQQKKYMK